MIPSSILEKISVSDSDSQVSRIRLFQALIAISLPSEVSMLKVSTTPSTSPADKQIRVASFILNLLGTFPLYCMPYSILKNESTNNQENYSWDQSKEMDEAIECKANYDQSNHEVLDCLGEDYLYHECKL